MELDFETCYRAVSSRDARFDGWFITGVTSTGIYCRPSCPAMTPKRANVRFFPTAAAAHAAGLRACKRCLPDASPGSPEWNVRGDVVARAMRLISDGVVDRDGVAELAGRLHFSERHIHRLLVEELGAGPQAIARAQRARNGAHLDRAHQAPVRGDRVRRRLQQHPPVQRHDEGGLRAHADRAKAQEQERRAGRRRRDLAEARVPQTVRRRSRPVVPRARGRCPASRSSYPAPTAGRSISRTAPASSS